MFGAFDPWMTAPAHPFFETDGFLAPTTPGYSRATALHEVEGGGCGPFVDARMDT